MALPPASEILGVALATGVSALWIYAAGQWALAEVFEAPGKTSQRWPFVLAGVTTVGLVVGLRSKRKKKRESK